MLGIRVTNGTYINRVRVGGIYDYAVNANCIVESHFFPAAAAVERTVQPRT